MRTKVIRWNSSDGYEITDLREAAGIIRFGGLVAFPTETVYGLGCDGRSSEAAAKVYEAKGRPSDNPLILHIADREMLDDLVGEIPEVAAKLIENFWPGPMTLVFTKSDKVPKQVTGGLETVAVRMPAHAGAAELIRAAGVPIAAPSANLSGKPSPTDAKAVIEDLDGRIDMIIDGGPVQIGLESTIIDMTEETPMILRPGKISRKMLEEVLGTVEVDRTILSSDDAAAPRAPGMKYRHYAPRGYLTIVDGDREAVAAYINRECDGLRAKGMKTGVLCTDETLSSYRADSVKSTGSRQDEDAAGRALFRLLREFDTEDVQVMFSESFEGASDGQAIMNRLMKAAGHRMVRV